MPPDKEEHPSDKIAIARLDERLKALDIDALNDLRVKFAAVSEQVKHNRALIFLLLSGLLAFAFAVWRGVV